MGRPVDFAQRTASTVTSGGNRNPANDPDPGCIGGQDRRRLIPRSSQRSMVTLNATVQARRGFGTHTRRNPVELVVGEFRPQAGAASSYHSGREG